jgi:hypothetical protein
MVKVATFYYVEVKLLTITTFTANRIDYSYLVPSATVFFVANLSGKKVQMHYKKINALSCV